ncbi:MAG: ROK family protein [Propionibacteriaceae bacterium]|nr:ROK family protein [Propionibacteriaceae bacterium]
MPIDADTKVGRLAAIFELLRAVESITVSELASLSGLSRPTVSALLGSLEERGLAVSGEPETVGAGRPAASWSLAPRAGYVLGVDVLRSTVLLSVARLDGAVVHAEFHHLPSQLGAERFVTLEKVLRAVADRHTDLGPLRAVTVSTTGTVDGEGVILRSTSVPDWEGFPLGERLSQVLGLPVRVENDINAAAYGEFTARWASGAMRPDDDLVYVHVAAGIVTGVVLGGAIHRGTAFNAGEFGLRLGSDYSEGEESTVQQVWQSLGAIAAVLDPSAIVISTTAPGHAVPRLRRYLAEHLEASAPTHHYEPALLGQASATVGALSLALADAQADVVGYRTARPHHPSGLERLTALIADGSHTSAEPGEASAARKLRVGVVGVGARSTILAHTELPHNNAEVVAACDPLPDTPERLEERTGIDPARVAISDNLDDFLNNDLDAAVITSPDDTHAEIACRLLEAGVAVYLEKPIAIEMEGATRILETAYRTGTRLYVGHNMRHMGVVRSMRDLIRKGTIGEVKAVWCRHFVGHGGDFYFKDWHADRRHSNGLLLQKAAHDIDVMNWLTDSHATRVAGMGGLTLYGDVEDRQDRSGQIMQTWFSMDNWPPLSHKGLNPVVDVEDLSMFNAEMASGAYVSYQQCHYTPDYWRNYTVIGTEGRLENFGDGEGGHIKLWNKRSDYNPDGDAQFPIHGDANGHDDADILTMTEFLDFVRNGTPTDTSPLGAWYAVATAIEATDSIRDRSMPRDIPELPQELVAYFEKHQVR